MDRIAKLKLAHAVALESFRESPVDSFEYRHLCDYEAALSRAGVCVAYDEDGEVSYDHNGEVSV